MKSRSSTPPKAQSRGTKGANRKRTGKENPVIPFPKGRIWAKKRNTMRVKKEEGWKVEQRKEGGGGGKKRWSSGGGTAELEVQQRNHFVKTEKKMGKG